MKTRFGPRLNLLLLLLCGLVVFAPGSYAIPLDGTVLVNGVGPVIVSATVIDFTPPVNPTGNGNGLFDIVAGSSGVFAALVGTQASVRDLNAGVVPAGVNVNYTNFVTFAAQPTWSITLTQLLVGIHSSAQCALPAAAGQVCTPFAGSPFNLVNNTSTSSTVSFTFIGTAVDSTTPSITSTVQGVFTSQFSNMNYQQILTAVSAPGGTVTNSNSASISLSSIPEPGTLSTALFGGLLIAGSIIARQFRR
jgi:hypothetical protein